MMSCVELNQPRKGFPGLRYMGCDKRIIVSQNAALIFSISISNICASIQRNTQNLFHYHLIAYELFYNSRTTIIS